MTIRWERFSGSTDRFALRLSFMPDPDAGRGADPADAASWGSIQIWVNGQNICAHIDQNEALQGAHWYMLPTLEWFVRNWNPIFHEERLPNANIGDNAVAALEITRLPPLLAGEAASFAWDEERFNWRSRHAIRTARDGGLLPNIVFRRLRDSLEVSWNGDQSAGTPDGFYFTAASGSVLIAPEAVAQPLYEVITAAVSYLNKELPGSARIGRLQEQLASLSAVDNTDVRLEWLAGLRENPPLEGSLQASMTEREIKNRWTEIVRALEGTGNADGASAALEVDESPLVLTGSCHASLLFSSVSPTISSSDVRLLSAVIVEQYSPGHVNELSKVSGSVELSSALRPWEQGYDLAESILDELGVDLSEDFVDVAAVLRSLGVTVLSRSLGDSDIRACCISGEKFAPTVVRNESSFAYRHPAASRFTLAHELCHLLFDRTHGRKLAIASGPWAPRVLEQRANAFAAMFLMPPDLVQRAVADLPDPVHDIASISVIAGKLQVSRRAATDHLFNMTLMSEAQRENLLSLITPE
jgi:Zn-dependent peptidase ImmA (M78 family)